MKIFEVANEHNHELITDRKKAEEWLHDHHLLNPNFKFKDGMLFTQSIDASHSQLKRIEVQFAPMHNFFVHDNKLESLKGSPNFVAGGFWCNSNALKSLKYSPKKVGKDFRCYGNLIDSLEYGPVEVVGTYDCSDNKLTSLQHAPEEVTYFCCNDNQIESLMHVPKRMNVLSIESNKIKTLAGIHKQITHVRQMHLGDNPIASAILGLILLPELNNIYLNEEGHSAEFDTAIDIVRKYLGKGRAGVLSAQDELQELDLDDFAHL